MKTKTISPSNEAIRQMMDWLPGQAVWRPALAAAIERQRDLLIERVFAGDDAAFESFTEHIGEQVFGWAFEAFLSRRIDGQVPDSPVDDFLKRRGWRLNPLSQRYLRAIRDSAPTLLEVVNVSPGSYVDVKDMLAPGKPFRVHERMGSRQMSRWDKLCARVVEMPEGRVFTGAILPIPGRASGAFVDAARQAIQRLTETVAAAGTTPERYGELVREALGAGAEEFLLLWMAQSVAAAAPPRITNSDGDAIVFHTRRYELKPKARQGLIAAFAQNADLQLTGERPRSWVWIQPPEDRATTSEVEPGLAFDGRDLDDPTKITAASLELKGSTLTVETNSAARLARVEQWLLPLLADAVVAASTQAQTLEEARAAAPTEGREGRPVPRHLKEKVEREFHQKHYRAWIDMQLPALAGATPREAAADPKRRDAVVELLKEMENRGAHGEQHGEAPFDFTSVWQALGILHLRE